MCADEICGCPGCRTFNAPLPVDNLQARSGCLSPYHGRPQMLQSRPAKPRWHWCRETTSLSIPPISAIMPAFALHQIFVLASCSLCCRPRVCCGHGLLGCSLGLFFLLSLRVCHSVFRSAIKAGATRQPSPAKRPRRRTGETAVTVLAW